MTPSGFVPASSLSQAQWAREPVSMPWRKWNDRNTVITEYEYFYPKDNETDWSTVAQATKHSFTVAGVQIDRVPEQVSTTRNGRIIGRWLVVAPLMEGYHDDYGTFCSSHWLWFIIGVLLLLLVVQSVMWRRSIVMDDMCD